MEEAGKETSLKAHFAWNVALAEYVISMRCRRVDSPRANLKEISL